MVSTLLDLKGLTPSIKSLAYGIEWLIVDKFVNDEQTRNVLCDNVSLLDEYARNKEDRLIRNLLRAGYSPQRLAKDAGVPLSRVRQIEKTLNP